MIFEMYLTVDAENLYVICTDVHTLSMPFWIMSLVPCKLN